MLIKQNFSIKIIVAIFAAILFASCDKSNNPIGDKTAQYNIDSLNSKIIGCWEYGTKYIFIKNFEGVKKSLPKYPYEPFKWKISIDSISWFPRLQIIFLSKNVKDEDVKISSITDSTLLMDDSKLFTKIYKINIEDKVSGLHIDTIEKKIIGCWKGYRWLDPNPPSPHHQLNFSYMKNIFIESFEGSHSMMDPNRFPEPFKWNIVSNNSSTLPIIYINYLDSKTQDINGTPIYFINDSLLLLGKYDLYKKLDNTIINKISGLNIDTIKKKIVGIWQIYPMYLPSFEKFNFNTDFEGSKQTADNLTYAYSWEILKEDTTDFPIMKINYINSLMPNDLLKIYAINDSFLWMKKGYKYRRK